MDNFIDQIRRHNAKIQSGSSTVVSMGLDKLGKSALGNLVTPAVWALNYRVNGAKPDSGDVFLFLAGYVASLPGTVVGLLKSVIDDRVKNQLRVVKQGEDKNYADYILPCATYSFQPETINAQIIASKGGTAWQHPNGLWVYIVDSKLNWICDYRPKKFITMYRAKMNEACEVGKKFPIEIVRT